MSLCIGIKNKNLIRLLRPHQWLKNLMLYFSPFLGGEIMRPGLLQTSALPLLCFCLASSASYVFNDIVDLKQDSHHPRKRLRPITSGAISLRTARVIVGVLTSGALLLASLLSVPLLLWITCYLFLSIVYTLWLKNIVLVDIFSIATFFLIRLLAGGAIFDIQVTQWLFLSVFLLALFLGAGKRLSELTALGVSAINHRGALADYSPRLLDGILYISASAVLVTYSMYSISHETLQFTVPLCAYGLLRYIYRIYQGQDGDPTVSLLKDPHLLVVGFLWVVFVGWGIYA